jgi:hypothetical protein
MVHCDVGLELAVPGLGLVDMTTKDLRRVGCPDETIHWHAACRQSRRIAELAVGVKAG